MKRRRIRKHNRVDDATTREQVAWAVGCVTGRKDGYAEANTAARAKLAKGAQKQRELERQVANEQARYRALQQATSDALKQLTEARDMIVSLQDELEASRNFAADMARPMMRGPMLIATRALQNNTPEVIKAWNLVDKINKSTRLNARALDLVPMLNRYHRDAVVNQQIWGAIQVEALQNARPGRTILLDDHRVEAQVNLGYAVLDDETQETPEPISPDDLSTPSRLLGTDRATGPDYSAFSSLRWPAGGQNFQNFPRTVAEHAQRIAETEAGIRETTEDNAPALGGSLTGNHQRDSPDEEENPQATAERDASALGLGGLFTRELSESFIQQLINTQDIFGNVQEIPLTPGGPERPINRTFYYEQEAAEQAADGLAEEVDNEIAEEIQRERGNYLSGRGQLYIGERRIGEIRDLELTVEDEEEPDAHYTTVEGSLADTFERLGEAAERAGSIGNIQPLEFAIEGEEEGPREGDQRWGEDERGRYLETYDDTLGWAGRTYSHPDGSVDWETSWAYEEEQRAAEEAAEDDDNCALGI